jgi:hypothetical protein
LRFVQLLELLDRFGIVRVVPIRFEQRQQAEELYPSDQPVFRGFDHGDVVRGWTNKGERLMFSDAAPVRKSKS